MIDYCSQCKGFWLDEGELDKVCEFSIKELSIPPAAKELTLCPKCYEAMFTFDYPQTFVAIEMCKKCRGLWFDAKELNEIQLVRKTLNDKNKLKEYDKVYGIKGTLIDFIEMSINYLKSV